MSAIASAGLAGARPALHSRASRRQQTQSPARAGNKQQHQQAIPAAATPPQKATPAQEGNDAGTHVNLATAGAEADAAQLQGTCGAVGELLCGCSGAGGAKRVSSGVCGYAGVAGSSQHGAYLIVSRALGAEFGGVVGLLYYIGHTLLIACYCLAAIEIVTVCALSRFYSLSSIGLVAACPIEIRVLSFTTLYNSQSSQSKYSRSNRTDYLLIQIFLVTI